MPTQNSAHLSESWWVKTMRPQPVTDSAHRPHTPTTSLPLKGYCGQRQAWVPLASGSTENPFAPAQTKTPKFIGFPGNKSNLSLLPPVLAHKELGVFPLSRSKLYTTAFLHMKQTSKKRDLTFFSPKSQPIPGVKPLPPNPVQDTSNFSTSIAQCSSNVYSPCSDLPRACWP